MGLRVPSSSWIYPRIFVNNLRKINTGHPEAADELVSDNVKEMSSPTRDGRTMIAAGLIHPRRAAEWTRVARPKRYHRRCSRLEPTDEFGFAKLAQRMSNGFG
jgi:hypothetical protein